MDHWHDAAPHYVYAISGNFPRRNWRRCLDAHPTLAQDSNDNIAPVADVVPHYRRKRAYGDDPRGSIVTIMAMPILSPEQVAEISKLRTNDELEDEMS